MNTRQTALPNGLRVVTTAMPGVESATVGVWVGVGGRHEPAAHSGISHFIEHLLFKGTRTRSARAISQAIEGRGGYCNAFTQEESTCYYVRMAAEHLDHALDILADMYLHARLAPADIAKERDVIIEEIMMYRDQPQHMVEELLGALLWQGHPLGWSLAGSPETLRAIRPADIRAFKRRQYAAGNTVLAFAGHVEHDACVRRVERILGGLARGRPPTSPPVTDQVPQAPLALQAKKTEQTHLALGARVFGRHDPRRYALKLLSIVLGENMSSRLFQAVRERHALAYSIQSGVTQFEESGSLVIAAGLDRRKLPRALRLIGTELARLGAAPVSRTELCRARDYAVGQLRLNLESSSQQMMWAGESVLAYGRVLPPEEVVAAIRAVRAEEVQALAAEVLRPARLSCAVIAPDLAEREGDELQACLAGGK